MKLSPPQSLTQIASLIKAEFVGNPEHVVSGINEIHKVEAGDLVFVDHPKYYDKALGSQASTILINKKLDAPENKALLISEDPFRDYNILTKHFAPFLPMSAAISDTAQIGEGTIIQPNAVIGNNVIIGNNCQVHSNTTIYDNCIIGDNVIIHANVIIGSDAFYYQKREGVFEKMHSCGRVVIGKNVEIGAGSTIDRGVSGDTIIGEGTKIDNLVQIGHDTEIGKNCLFASQVGISGATIIKDNVKLWGQVGVTSGLVIGEGVEVYAQSGVHISLEAGRTYFGSPVGESRGKMKELAMIKRLPELFKKP